MKKEKEIRIVNEMILMYCRGKHKSKKDVVCKDCDELMNFVKLKREKCPFNDNKNYCSLCKIHCYKSNQEKREKIREVMKYSGPRMLFVHPFLALSHVYETLKGRIKNAR